MADENQQKRQIAYKARIIDITEGKYVRASGWLPNYILTNEGRELSRINIIGTVISKEADLNNEYIVIDDGTSSIMIRSFEKDEGIAKSKIGDVVLVVGRPREYGNDKFILPEIIKNIDNPKWITLRQLEMLKEFGEFKKKEVIEGVVKEELDDNEIPSQKIYNVIKELDKGDGAEIEEVIARSNIANAEEIIKILIREGEMYQNRPGKIKIL